MYESDVEWFDNDKARYRNFPSMVWYGRIKSFESSSQMRVSLRLAFLASKRRKVIRTTQFTQIEIKEV